MITNEKFSEISYQMASHFEAINTDAINKMGEHLRDMGKLTATDMHRLEQMNRMNANVQEINRMLRKQCQITQNQLNSLYLASGLDIYENMAIFYGAKGVRRIPFNQNARIQHFIQSVSDRTANTFENISRTTAISSQYRKLVDRGIYAVTSGMQDYKSATRSILRESSMRGMRVEYDSGYTRRLDSAVTLNILEGVRTLNIGMHKICGEEFGADGWELSVHALCAKDHLDYQGNQYTNRQMEDLMHSLDRPFGELNCQHIMFPIVLGVSTPTYTTEELQEMKDYSEELIDVGDGKMVSRYDASQLMRNLETQTRYAKDEYIGAVAAQDEVLKSKADAKIKRYRAKYLDICEKTGIEPKFDRMTVPGFKREKVRKVIIP